MDSTYSQQKGIGEFQIGATIVFGGIRHKIIKKKRGSGVVTTRNLCSESIQDFPNEKMAALYIGPKN